MVSVELLRSNAMFAQPRTHPADANDDVNPNRRSGWSSMLRTRIGTCTAMLSSRLNGRLTSHTRAAIAEPTKPARALTLEGNAAGNRKFNLCASRGLAKDVKLGSHSLRALTHSREPPVSIAACSQYFWVNAAAIVSH
jgi:hypothetical protein